MDLATAWATFSTNASGHPAEETKYVRMNVGWEILTSLFCKTCVQTKIGKKWFEQVYRAKPDNGRNFVGEK
jgi:hypothetical protein